jgi:GH15 family glucan-1,4-alpha-glucosidase
MPLRIEDYALIGDCHTAGLVSKEGSIDWLCLPRFDSSACFASLLGTKDHGRWLIAPIAPVKEVRRQYRGDTLVLETVFVTDEGEVALIDFMPIFGQDPDLVRIVEGRKGKVRMHTELILRFDYGSMVPWVRAIERGITAIAGPDTVEVRADVPLHGKDLSTVSEFEVAAGQKINFDLSWHSSLMAPTREKNHERQLKETEKWWSDWGKKCTYTGPYKEAVKRSLITLKGLTYAPSGGIVAAPTTSLPEALGSVRNWDYRFCWLRDATFTLISLINCGFEEEAYAWREWLLRAIAGNPEQISIMYSITGKRRLPEHTLDWLPGYEGSRPVRTGNAAYCQFQLDVFGEVADMLYQYRRAELHKESVDGSSWNLERKVIEYLEKVWTRTDEGIWEVRGPRRHFTHSKLMSWVAIDRGVRSIEQFKVEGPLERWRKLRDDISDEICREGFNPSKNSFVQYYGCEELDASLLMMPLVGFLPATDSRIVGTVAAIERELVTPEGFVARYISKESLDGLPAGEATFLPCTFWLADNYALQGRGREAKMIFERLLSIRNDVGLLAEEYDTRLKRQLGNFPQAFTHIGLINTALYLQGIHNEGERIVEVA